MDLANKVRNRREELGWSQEELAHKMGYSSRTSINKIEMGRPCSQKIIARLAEALNVSIAYLMDWDQEQITAIEEVKNDANTYDDKLETNLRLFMEEFGKLQLSKEEMQEVYEYAKYVKSKRN